VDKLSKALCFAAAGTTTATGVTSQPTDVVGGAFTGLLAAGICVLTGWAFLRILRPEKFFLRRVPGRSSQLNVLHVLALFLMYCFSVPLAQRALASAWNISVQSIRDLPMTVKVPGTIFGQLVLIGGTLTVAAMSFRHGLGRGLGLRFRRIHWDAARAVIAYLAVVPLCYAALYISNSLLPPSLKTAHPMLTFLQSRRGSPLWVALVWISAVVLAPLAEELFYRGLIQSMLRRYGLKPWPAIAITSLVFAASHAGQVQDMLALLILAVALGYNYERTGRLIAPVLLHAIFNAVTIWTIVAS